MFNKHTFDNCVNINALSNAITLSTISNLCDPHASTKVNYAGNGVVYVNTTEMARTAFEKLLETFRVFCDLL